MFRNDPKKQAALWEGSRTIGGCWQDRSMKCLAVIALLSPSIRSRQSGWEDAAAEMMREIAQYVSLGSTAIDEQDDGSYTQELVLDFIARLDALVLEAFEVFGVKDCVLPGLDRMQGYTWILWGPLFGKEQWPQIRSWWVSYLGAN